MRAIQKHLPNPRHVETVRIFVKAKPEEAWQAARHFDASDIPWVKLLFDIRSLPGLISGSPKKIDKRLGVDQITDNTGFFIAEEIPGKEVVIASVGKFWHLEIPFANVSPADFRNFEDPGWGKLAWGFSVEPYRNGSTICLELRTTATDDESWQKLRNYYRVIGIGSKLIRHAGMERLEDQLKKTDFLHESMRPLAGDDIIPNTKYSKTYGINIEAPMEIVWSYLMQLGCDRAGWYSIDELDNGGVPSVDHIVPGWEKRKPGDKISATPDLDSFFTVYELNEQKAFVMGGETRRMGSLFKMSWVFVIEPVGEDATHLISRARMSASAKLTEWLLGNVLYPPVHGLMTRAQLKTIKRYAERDALIRKPEEVILQLNLRS